MTKTALVYSDAYGRFDYGPEHPLRMERLGLTWRLMEAYGLTTLPNVSVRAPEPATERALALWHTPDYLDVLKAANGGVVPEHAARCGLGPGDNPVFPGLWDAARLCAGGSRVALPLATSSAASSEPPAQSRAASQSPRNTGLSPGPRPQRAACSGTTPPFAALRTSR